MKDLEKSLLENVGTFLSFEKREKTRHEDTLTTATTTNFALFLFKMKYGSNSLLLALAALSSVSAFAPNINLNQRAIAQSCLSVVVTGPDGKPASSKEEDMALTFAIIMGHDARSVTVTAEQFVSQKSENSSNEDNEEGGDVSIPYDAAAKNAYEAASDKSMAYADFKTKYEADAVALVKSKQPIDVSIPYDAAAKNAYEAASDKSMTYADFKTKYEAGAVADVIAKQSS